MWFHLPIRSRQWISSLMLFALLVQIPDAICHSYWYSYLMTQAWPGGLVTNVWLGVQLLCQISASNIQNRAEARVRKADPKRFPPVLTSYLGEAWRRWREETPEGQRPICSGKFSFIAFVRAELKNYKEQCAKFGDVDGLTGIHVSEVHGKVHTEDLKSMFKSAAQTTTAANSLAAHSTRSIAKARSKVAPSPQAYESSVQEPHVQVT